MSRSAGELDAVFAFLTVAVAAWFGVGCWIAGVIGRGFRRYPTYRKEDR